MIFVINWEFLKCMKISRMRWFCNVLKISEKHWEFLKCLENFWNTSRISKDIPRISKIHGKFLKYTENFWNAREISEMQEKLLKFKKNFWNIYWDLIKYVEDEIFGEFLKFFSSFWRTSKISGMPREFLNVLKIWKFNFSRCSFLRNISIQMWNRLNEISN